MSTGPTLIAVATIAVGGFNMVYGGRLVWRSWRARRWPTLEGRLISADLLPRKPLAAKAVWGLRVLYRYSVGPDTYTGANMSPEGGPTFFSEELGRLAIAQQWQPGTAVQVHVHPSDPGNAMLAPRVSLLTVSMLVLGAAMTAAGVWQLLSA